MTTTGLAAPADAGPVPQATHWACMRCGAHRPVSHVKTGPPPLGGDAAARWAIHTKTCTRRTR